MPMTSAITGSHVFFRSQTETLNHKPNLDVRSVGDGKFTRLIEKELCEDVH